MSLIVILTIDIHIPTHYLHVLTVIKYGMMIIWAQRFS